jgi:hypothetical protein
MIVRAIGTRGGEFMPWESGLFYTPATEFPVVKGRDYKVFGQMFFQDDLAYLVQDENGIPRWLPSRIFDIVDNSIKDWMFSDGRNTQAEDQSVKAGYRFLWGYPLLVNDPDHLAGLMDADTSAIATFDSLQRQTRE